MIEHARLLDVMNYDAAAGVFTWKVNNGKARAGKTAGYANNGYWKITIDYEVYTGHVLAWFYVYGVWPSKDIDHRDTDGLNNAIDNLREATPTQNRWNTAPKLGHSKWKGVTYDKGRKKCWKMGFKMPDGAQIQKRFEDEREAAEEYMFLALEHHGEFARLQ